MDPVQIATIVLSSTGVVVAIVTLTSRMLKQHLGAQREYTRRLAGAVEKLSDGVGNLREVVGRLEGRQSAQVAQLAQIWDVIRQMQDDIRKLSEQHRDDYRKLSEQIAHVGAQLAALGSDMKQIEPIQARQAEHERELGRLQATVLQIRSWSASSGPGRPIDAGTPGRIAAQSLPSEEAED